MSKFHHAVRIARVNSMVLSAILAMAGSLDIAVIAEGVERVEQLDLLKSFGCDLAQGFLFGKPVPAAEFTAAPAPHGRTHP